MTYPCLVLDHDDTVVNSTATVHYPCFAEYTAKFFPKAKRYTLEEYGTVVMRGVGTPTLENSKSHNFAYKKGKADPIFSRAKGMIQYTNVLVGFSLDDCKDTLTLRPYIKLKDMTTGETVTLYGGCVCRSIYQVAKQNENTYKPGTAGYKYIHKILNYIQTVEQGG